MKYEDILSRKGAKAQRKDVIRETRGSRGYFVNTKENKYEDHEEKVFFGKYEEKKDFLTNLSLRISILSSLLRLFANNQSEYELKLFH